MATRNGTHFSPVALRAILFEFLCGRALDHKIRIKVGVGITPFCFLGFRFRCGDPAPLIAYLAFCAHLDVFRNPLITKFHVPEFFASKPVIAVNFDDFAICLLYTSDAADE